MMLFIISNVVLLLQISSVHSSVIPHDNSDSRVVDLPPPPTNSDRATYDHEAFLGKEAQHFDALSPDESKQRLAIIYDKIDKNQDGLITEPELKDWIQYVQLRFTTNNVKAQWKNYHGDNPNQTIAWVSYREKTYGQLAENEVNKDTGDEVHAGGFNFHHLERRDLRRWSLADENADGVLSIQEFKSFLHPEETEHMKDIVIEETIEDMDKDKDGRISLEEYIMDMWPKEDSNTEEPEWIANERAMWQQHRDINKDGFMDKHEVRQWILPDGYDHIRAEARHLIYEADDNKDGNLTKDEVLDKYSLFVSSQATDYGDAIRHHDEF